MPAPREGSQGCNSVSSSRNHWSSSEARCSAHYHRDRPQEHGKRTARTVRLRLSLPLGPRNALHLFRDSPHPFKDLLQHGYALLFGEQGRRWCGRRQWPQEWSDPNEQGNLKRNHTGRNPPVKIPHHPLAHKGVVDDLKRGVHGESKQDFSFDLTEPNLERCQFGCVYHLFQRQQELGVFGVCLGPKSDPNR
jgi:hypothetical protein